MTGRILGSLTALFAGVLLSTPAVAAESVKVCVDVQVRSWSVGTEPPAAPVTPAPPADVPVDPYAIDPARYLARNVAYEVTHEIGFEAAEKDCAERLTVELYPLRSGWTVFARYTGTAREEKIDQVELDEFVALARRLTIALLNDESVNETITRDTVLEADSESDLKTIHGTGHLVLALGTLARYGELNTASDSGSAPSKEGRLLTPLSVQIGYRGKYQAWGLDVFVRGALGTSEIAPRRNPTGGHIDFEGNGAAGLHFLRYVDPKGMNSLYFGGGAQFELSRFSVIKPNDQRGSDDRTSLYGGGLEADLVLGYEFMRASTVHFFVQGEANIPTFRFDTEVDEGGVDTYLPGGTLQIGMIF